MTRRVVSTIARRELLDTVRDKRTLIMMIAVPLFLYPALILISVQLAVSQFSRAQEQEARLVLTGPGADSVRSWFEHAEGVSLVGSAEPAAALGRGDVDVVLVVPEDAIPKIDGGETAKLTLQYDRAEIRSRVAQDRVEEALDAKAKELREARLATRGLSPSFIQPIEAEAQDLAPPSKAAGQILGALLPTAMVLMIALGAYYPAVDLTAGEKERGTFETLLSTPISKLEIVTGKFFAVFGIALVTGLLNLASMSTTSIFMLLQLPEEMRERLSVGADLPWEAFISLLITIVPLSFFIAAAMMAVAVFARSFKEAANYVGPLMFVLMGLTMYAAAPGVELGAANQFIPVTNVVLLFKAMLMGKAGLVDTFGVFLSTGVVALLAVMFAASIFQREEVVLADEKGIPLTLRRRQFRPRSAPTPMMGMGLFGVVMLLIFYVGALLQQRAMLPGLLITEWVLIFAVVVSLLLYTKIDLRSALSLKASSSLVLIGAVLAAAGAVVLMMQFGYYHNKVLPVPQELQDTFNEMFSFATTPGGLLLLLFIAAVSPAICEEVLFRGALLSSLRGRLHPFLVIVLVGALFGAFHISIYRVLPTGILGLLLTWITLRSGSIFPAMLSHFVVNSLGIIVGTGWLPEPLSKLLKLEEIEKTGLPSYVLLAGAVCFICGVLLIEHKARARIQQQ